MKIIKFDELVQMPKGTVFAEWRGDRASHWFVKGLSHKFGPGDEQWCLYETNLEPELADDPNFPPRFIGGWIKRQRWDTLDEHQLYLVLDDQDRLFMIHMLTLADA